MKSMTPFQQALLAATESQFADVPEEEQIDIHPSQEFYDNIPGKRKPLKPLRKALMIAASLALLVGAVFANRFFTLGQPEVIRFPYRAEGGADSFVIRFEEAIADEDAPHFIETYYLPTANVSPENVSCVRIYGSGKEFCWTPMELVHDLERDTDRPPKKPTTFYGSWYVGDKQITFRQAPARNVLPGEDYWSIYYTDGLHVSGDRVETLQIGDHEVLSILAEYAESHTGELTWHYYWFWTDGSYIFHLSADEADKAYMQQLMESVQPIEDMSPYFGEE